MFRASLALVAMAVSNLILDTAIFAEEVKPMTPTQQWNGSVADDELGKGGTLVITEAKEFEKIWTDWKIEGKLPEIDFAKQVVTVSFTRGSKINLRASVTEKGDLQIGGIATRDLRPGTRYVIAVFPREGLKSVNGKAWK